MAASNAQTLALQLEYVRPELPLLYQLDHTLLDMIQSRGKMEMTSTRPARIPMEILAGSKFRQVNPDGGGFGRGSGPTNAYGTLSPVYFAQASEYTKLSDIATNSDEKAIKSYAKQLTARAMDQIKTNLEAVLAQGDGSNTLDSVVSVSGSVLTVNNANQFSANQDVDIWSGLGGTFRGTVTILTADGPNKQLTTTAPPPSGTTTGDLLLVNGSAGVANSGLAGLFSYQSNATTGTYMGLDRTAYPGMLTTPYVNGGNAALTPQVARRMLAQMQSAMGIKAPEREKLVFHMNTDMSAAWENVGVVVAQVIQNQLKGDSSQDMLMKTTPKTFAGRPLVENIHAKQGRIDGLALAHWFWTEIQPLDYYEVEGQTVFPTYDATGGINSTMLFYLWLGRQLGCDNPRAGTYSDNLAIPTGY